MLTANTKIKLGIGGAAAIDSHLHQRDHSVIDRLKRIGLENVTMQINRDELRLGVIAGEAERGLG